MTLSCKSTLYLITLLPMLLTGCTMNIGLSEKEQSKSDQPVDIRFQSISSIQGHTYHEIHQADLQEGDLLFSSAIGLTSLGIRLFSASPVSHVAIYVGHGQVAESVGAGVQIITLEKMQAESDKLFALRMPGLTTEQLIKIHEFAQQKVGSHYNYQGIAEMIPFMVTKQLCSLNPFSQDFRQQCVKGLAAAQLDSPTNGESRYFCSQFVLAAFEYAGQPLTVAKSGWVSPGDLLHMREGDIATLAPSQSLHYIGHIKPGIYLRSKTPDNNNHSPAMEPTSQLANQAKAP
ncbi:hypothetical protein C9426_20080 [Serratia sp. S1B]|nr:hypothetical protein C9426_20080 [Serratia sp. S1B]